VTICRFWSWPFYQNGVINEKPQKVRTLGAATIQINAQIAGSRSLKEYVTVIQNVRTKLAPQGAFYLHDDGALRCGAGDRARGGRIHVAGGAIDRGGASGILMPNEN
jgi:hypothetical protein